MVAANPTSPLHPLHSIECHPACTVYPACTERSRSEPRREPSRSERSEGSAFDFSPVSVSASSSLSSSFNFKLSTACPEARRRVSFLSLSPFLATLTDSSQPIENPATLSPAFATLTSFVNPNPFVCHSYEKHPGWGYPLIALSAKLFSPLSCYPAPNPFRIRTSAKHARNSCGIRTSKTQDLKPFRIRTYEKTPGGRGPRHG
jgi:hypothetical protein